MIYYLVKIVATALIVVLVSEVAKRSSFWAAALASVPLTSILAFVWLYIDTKSPEKVAVLSQGIFWLVIPSLLMFIVLPALLRVGLNFWLSLAASCTLTALAYAAVTWALKRAGITL